MTFIELQDGLSVKIDEIVAVQRMADQFRCKVFTETQEFEAHFPYLTLLSLLEADKPEVESNKDVLKEISQKVGNLPVFAG